ncbi:A/G-specific adenine glycosylase [Piscinibacterium candidicorallinum]|uniref:Adenine DNA glycosylase n=1 Tax=Piscinibacterium candidicorallinum TaxID=1793872 RepID=A0ABV7H8S1_9BURK
MKRANQQDFAQAVVAWQRTHGRHDLPWQGSTDPYRVWVSEIMLQQTQVSTVIPYYLRFMARFPDVLALADAPDDEVMQHWAGLGYYSRARNLHAAARDVRDRFGGQFPTDPEALQSLRGIGRSTAAAIAAFSANARAAILDGNVKRVLARVFAIQGFPGSAPVERQMWALADSLLPAAGDMPAYTQGLMDLGATLCTPKRPRCGECPLADRCEALRQSRVAELPVARPRKTPPRRGAVFWLVVDASGGVLLQKRPPVGIWGGLWSLPQTEPGQAAPAGVDAQRAERFALIEHAFTHFTLEIDVQRVALPASSALLAAEPGARWFTPAELAEAGVPKPVRTVLDSHLAQLRAEAAAKRS